ncbi:hypothetical protein GN956_G9371 [Arapaima gigas]
MRELEKKRIKSSNQVDRFSHSDWTQLHGLRRAAVAPPSPDWMPHHVAPVLTGPPQPTASCFPSWSSLCITRQVRGLGVPTMPELQLASPLHCPCESPSSLP